MSTYLFVVKNETDIPPPLFQITASRLPGEKREGEINMCADLNSPTPVGQVQLN